MSPRAHPPPTVEPSRLLFWIGTLALLVRLLYFHEHLASAFATVPVLDAKHWDQAARALLSGADPLLLGGGFRPLLYPVFLASVYRLAGGWDSLAALGVQHLLGVVTALLAAALAARLFRSRPAGAAAGVLYALAGPPLYFEGELLATSLFTFLTTLLLWLLVRAEESPTAGRWIAAGLVLALAAEARPSILVLAPALLAAGLLDRRRGRGALLALAAAAAGLLAAALLRTPWTQGFQLLPSAGGINLYLGNRAGADGMIPRQERAVTYGESYRDSVQVFAEEIYREAVEEGTAGTGRPIGGPIDPGALSRYWTSRALEEIAREPGRWLGLMGRKALFLVWNREIPNNKSYSFVLERESLLLRWLPVRWWLLLALAPAGVWYGWRRGFRGGLLWLLAFTLLFALGLLLFFVNSRFRVPLWPAMAVLAGGGVAGLWAGLLQGAFPWRQAAAGAALATLSLVSWTGVELPGHARDLFFRSIAHLERGDPEAAAADARESLALDPEDPAAHYQLGASLEAAGELEEAAEAFREAIRLRPEEPRSSNALGVVLESLDRPAEAYLSYLRALELEPRYVPAWTNAALLELRAGLTERAEAKIARAEALGGDSVQLLSARALLEESKGNVIMAREILSKINDKNPGSTAALLERHRNKIDSVVLLSFDQD